jgi:hypothetical protein
MRTLMVMVAIGTLVLPACGGKTPAGGGANGESESETSGDGDTDTETGEESSSTDGGECANDDDCGVDRECENGECVHNGCGSTCDDQGYTFCCSGYFCPGVGGDCEPEKNLECDPGLQDCPDGEKCTAYAENPGSCCVDATKCVDIIGDLQLGDVCNRMPENDDCAKGLFCMTQTSGDTGDGVCRAFCDINNPASCTDAGLPEADCIAYNDGVLPLCAEPCDPLGGGDDCHNPEDLCVPNPAGGFVCVLDASGGLGSYGASCQTHDACNQGLFCADAGIVLNCGSQGCCSEFCDVNEPNTCAGMDDAQLCIPWWEEGLPPELAHVGGCAIPPNIGSSFAHQAVAGQTHSCSRDDDGVECWGTDWDGEGTPPNGPFKQIDFIGQTSCGVKADDTAACWGNDSSGQATPPGGTFKFVGAGQTHSCGIRTDDTLACWGADDNGKATPPGGTFKHLAVGAAHNCAIRTDDTAACWGTNFNGEATAPNGTFKQITAGHWHSCALKFDDTAQCWGANNSGQLDAPNLAFQQLSGGGRSTCGVTDVGHLECWGENMGQVVPAGNFFKQVNAGWRHACAIRLDDLVQCWGANVDGQTFPP